MEIGVFNVSTVEEATENNSKYNHKSLEKSIILEDSIWSCWIQRHEDYPCVECDFKISNAKEAATGLQFFHSLRLMASHIYAKLLKT